MNNHQFFNFGDIPTCVFGAIPTLNFGDFQHPRNSFQSTLFLHEKAFDRVKNQKKHILKKNHKRCSTWKGKNEHHRSAIQSPITSWIFTIGILCKISEEWIFEMNFTLKLYRAQRHLKFNTPVLFWLRMYVLYRFANRCETFTWKILRYFFDQNATNSIFPAAGLLVMFCSSRTPRVPPRTPGGPYGNLRAGLNRSGH